MLLVRRAERDFLVTEDEAKKLWGDEYKVHWHVEKQGYSIGLDMFHTLHCLVRTTKIATDLRLWLHVVKPWKTSQLIPH